jgi:hypothetical protein
MLRTRQWVRAEWAGRWERQSGFKSGRRSCQAQHALLHSRSRAVLYRRGEVTANRLGAGDIWAYMQPCHAARSWSLCRLARAATTPIPGTNLGPRYSRPQSPTINITPSPLARAPNLSFKTCPLSVSATLGDTRAPPRPNAGLQILTLGQWACITCCLLRPVLRPAHFDPHHPSPPSIPTFTSCQMVPNSHDDSQWYLSPGPEICLSSRPHSGLFNNISLCPTLRHHLLTG